MRIRDQSSQQINRREKNMLSETFFTPHLISILLHNIVGISIVGWIGIRIVACEIKQK